MFEIHGGVHTDTTFTEIVPGTEESYGPFESYDHAVNVWRGKMGANIDICEHRLFIRPLGKDDCERCLGERGGVPGNENVIEGVVLCDYCTAEELTVSKFQRLDFVTITSGPHAGEKGRVHEVLSGKQYAVKVLTGPEANQQGTYVAQESQLEPDDNPEMSACDKCGAEYPSAPLGTIHKCGRCSGGYCQRKKALVDA